MAHPSDIVAGSCGFRSSREKYYARFPVVEVQHTFYQPPSVSTLEGWRSEAPETFEFTLKAWQLITHEPRSPTYRRLRRKLTDRELADAGAFRNTPIVREAWEITAASALALRARSVLFQCPASFTPTEEHADAMRELITSIDRGDFRLCWEPRGGWPHDLVRDLCDELRLVHVVDPFADTSVTPDDIYFRLHGRTGYRYVYEDFELEELLEMMPAEGRSHVFFNNIAMREDAERFNRLVEKSSA
jgi:uncharacterized protein YecE (DUF72 family)